MSLRILALEPYFSGSHKQFLEDLKSHSNHEITILSLAGKNWKWHMRSSPLAFANMLNSQELDFDVIFSSDFVDLGNLISLVPKLSNKCRITYFHENQFAYPSQANDERDIHFSITNVMTYLASDFCWFNSQWNYDSFILGAKNIAKLFPASAKFKLNDDFSKNSAIVPLGISPTTDNAFYKIKDPPHILWNHRWEFDKGPNRLLQILRLLKKNDFDFRLSICGEAYNDKPPEFSYIEKEFSENLIHFGYLDSKDAYYKLLIDADFILSTAVHEFFGISALEAMERGCYPILPNRLSYPELLPKDLYDHHLYNSEEDAVSMIKSCDQSSFERSCKLLKSHISQYHWQKRILDFDMRFEKAYSA